MLNGEGPEDWGNYSKFFDREDFGFREIRVERPLRLNFQASAERLARLTDEKAIRKLDETESQELIDALSGHLPTILFTNREEFQKALNKALKGSWLKPGAPVKKAILSALSERDKDADICGATMSCAKSRPSFPTHGLMRSTLMPAMVRSAVSATRSISTAISTSTFLRAR